MSSKLKAPELAEGTVGWGRKAARNKARDFAFWIWALVHEWPEPETSSPWTAEAMLVIRPNPYGMFWYP